MRELTTLDSRKTYPSSTAIVTGNTAAIVTRSIFEVSVTRFRLHSLPFP